MAKKLTEKQKLQEISQLIKKDVVNLKKSNQKEPNSIEVICNLQDIFHKAK